MLVIVVVIVIVIIYYIYHKDNFEIIKVIMPAPAQKFYIEEIPEKLDLNSKMTKKMLQTGKQAEIINRGLTKSSVDVLRPIFKKELDYNEDLEWWNESRT